MGRNKRGSGIDWLYDSQLFGRRSWAQYNPAAQRERQIAMMLGNVMTELAMNRFKWDGLPDSVDVRFLELTLFYRALAIYYREEEFDKEIVVQGSGASQPNVFDNPISFNVISPGTRIDINGADTNIRTSKMLHAYDPARHSELGEIEKRKLCVPIWANYLRYPELNVVQIYSSRLAWIDRTIEINSKNARRNKVLKSTPDTQLSLVNFNNSIDRGEEVIQVTGPLADMDAITTIDFGIPADSFEKLSILRARTWNEAMGLLGIDNANQDKKERLVAAEVGANDSQTDSMRYVSLNARRQACELISDVFGTKVTVDFNTEIEQRAKEVQSMTDPSNKDDE